MKQAKKFISILLATIMTLSVFAAMPMTVSAATATEGWGADPDDGIFYINNENDMLAFNANAVANGNYSGKTVKLTKDINMSGITWTPIATFAGILDGQGNSIKNLTMTGTTSQIAMVKVLQNATIKDIKFVDCSSTGTHTSAIIGTLPSGTVNFENVYVSGTLNATEASGAFLAKTMGSNRVVNFKNCISDVTLNCSGGHNGGFFGKIESNTSTLNFENCISNASVSGTSKNGGFVGTILETKTGNSVIFNGCMSNATFNTTGNATGGFVGCAGGASNSVAITDCVFTGNLATGTNVVSPAVGFLSANIKLERFVSIGDVSASIYNYRGALLFLDKEITLTNSKIEIVDCYAALAGGKAINASSTGSRGINYDISISYNGQKVFEHKDSTVTATLDKTNGLFSQLGNIESVFKTIGTADGATLTAENFSEVCPALASSGKWAVTTETVEYASGKNIVKILPASVAHMINAPIEESPNATEILQFRPTSAGYDMQFTGAVNVDDLNDYASVGFDVVVKIQDGATLMTETVKTQYVYTSIVADGADVSASTLGADYLNVLQIKGFKSGNVYEISILSFAEKADGTVVYDYNGALNVTVQNGALVD